MRNSILAISIAFVLAAPCTALAGDKKEKAFEVNSFSWGQANLGTAGTGGGAGAGATKRVGSPTTKAPTPTTATAPKLSGSAGPSLYQKLNTGVHYNNATINVR